MKKIAILFSGNGTNLEHILKTLHKKKIEVVITITNNPKAKGKEISQKYNVPCFTIDSNLLSREDFDYLIVEKLIQYQVDITVLAGFMRKLTPYFVQHITAINLHPSLLPLHKGLNAIEKSYKDNNEYGGVSVHYVSENLDEGEIILQEKIKKDNLTFEEYLSKIKKKEKEILEKSIELLIL